MAGSSIYVYHGCMNMFGAQQRATKLPTHALFDYGSLFPLPFPLVISMNDHSPR